MLDGGTERERTGSSALSRDPAWNSVEKPGRDWKKVVLIVGLGLLSWAATYVGMLELIEANIGELPFVYKIIIAFSVAMLMTMIVWLLDQLFAPLPFSTKLLYVMGYVFLTLISVGFGFGFYWKVLESRGEASRVAESAVSHVQAGLNTASTRLDQLQQTLASLTAISLKQAEVERATGGSCPNSRPGDGPRRRMRDADAARFSFSADFVGKRTGAIKTDMKSLDGALAKIASNDGSIVSGSDGTRNAFMRELGRKLGLTVTRLNAFRSDPQLRQIRSDLADRSERTVFPNGSGGTFTCPDPQLQAALRGVVRAIDQLPLIETPQVAVVEGSEATIEAFRRLTSTLYGVLSFKLPPTADELRELQQKAVQSVDAERRSGVVAVSDVQPGLSKRDYVPLAIALFVDLCLLLVSMGRPMNRLQGLVPKMLEAERGPVIQILARFNEIHRDERIRENFDIFRHVVFDYAGSYYVAVPLDAPRTRTTMREVFDERKRRPALVEMREPISDQEREELRLDAHLLANLFTSFERENIFKRLDTRFLARGMRLEPDTTIVRNRLRRQGSKFADADAFRVYKFFDGAWSEIILGAVMGAARRIEDVRADERHAGGVRIEPSFESLALRLRDAELEAASEAELPRAKPAYKPDEIQEPEIVAQSRAAGAFDDGARLKAVAGGQEAVGERAKTKAKPRHHYDNSDARLDAAHEAWDELWAQERTHARGAANNNTGRSGLAPVPAASEAVAANDADVLDDEAKVLRFRSLREALAQEDDTSKANVAEPLDVEIATVDLAEDEDDTPAQMPSFIRKDNAGARSAGVDVTLSQSSVTMTLPQDDPRLRDTLFGLSEAVARVEKAATPLRDVAIETADAPSPATGPAFLQNDEPDKAPMLSEAGEPLRSAEDLRPTAIVPFSEETTRRLPLTPFRPNMEPDRGA